MNNQRLSPSAKLTLDALDAGPGNVHELSERTGRSRSTTDKAINDLAKAGLIIKVDDGGDPADGAPTRWQLADPAPADDQTTQPEPTGDADSDTDAAGTAQAHAATPDDATEAPSGGSPEPADHAQPVTDEPAPDGGETTGPAADTPADNQTKPDGDATSDGEQTPAQAEPPKLCRGCQAQMPKICQSCWQKTPTYCGTCRKDMPQARRGEPGEPVILSNGLPKLRPGELEAMVEKVMRDKELPAWGFVGWTGGRVAIHLPGRSTGAINNALEKLERNGVAELIGDKPMRYKLKDAEQPDADAKADTGNDGQDEANQTETIQPAADTRPQPRTTA